MVGDRITIKGQSLLGIVAFVFLLTGCGPQPVTPTSTPTSTPLPTPTGSAHTDEYLVIFDMVWQTVNDTYFDPTFGGLDWRAVYDNTFFPDLIPDMLSAIESMQDAPGIIVDLRGNPGGYAPAGEALVAQFIEERAHLGTFKTRDGAFDSIVEPAEETYEGPVLILIDALSFSCSEWVASGMQAIGRAVIVGEHSPGGLTGMGTKTLPNGGLLVYPIMQIVAPDGTVLEGQGVIPDITVPLDRELLLQGVDSQLTAAIEYIKEISNAD